MGIALDPSRADEVLEGGQRRAKSLVDTVPSGSLIPRARWWGEEGEKRGFTASRVYLSNKGQIRLRLLYAPSRQVGQREGPSPFSWPVKLGVTLERDKCSPRGSSRLATVKTEAGAHRPPGAPRTELPPTNIKAKKTIK